MDKEGMPVSGIGTKLKYNLRTSGKNAGFNHVNVEW